MRKYTVVQVQPSPTAPKTDRYYRQLSLPSFRPLSLLQVKAPSFSQTMSVPNFSKTLQFSAIRLGYPSPFSFFFFNCFLHNHRFLGFLFRYVSLRHNSPSLPGFCLPSLAEKIVKRVFFFFFLLLLQINNKRVRFRK